MHDLHDFEPILGGKFEIPQETTLHTRKIINLLAAYLQDIVLEIDMTENLLSLKEHSNDEWLQMKYSLFMRDLMTLKRALYYFAGFGHSIVAIGKMKAEEKRGKLSENQFYLSLNKFASKWLIISQEIISKEYARQHPSLSDISYEQWMKNELYELEEKMFVYYHTGNKR